MKDMEKVEQKHIDNIEEDDRINNRDDGDLSHQKDKTGNYQSAGNKSTKDIDLEHRTVWRSLAVPWNNIFSKHRKYNVNGGIEKSSEQESPRRLRIILCVSLLLLVLSSIVVVVILESKGINDGDTVDYVEIKMETTLNKTFTKELEDENSNGYKNLSENFCLAVSEAFRSESSLFNGHNITCEVTDIRAGSVIIGFTVQLQGRTDTSTPNSTYVNILRHSLGPDSKFGALLVKLSSIKVITISYGLVTPTATIPLTDIPSTTVSVEDTPDFTLEIRFTTATWHEDFSDPSSATYTTFTSGIEKEMDMIFEKSFLKDIYNRTVVTSLVKGSIVASMSTFVDKLSFSINDQNSQKVTVKLAKEDFKDAFMNGKQQHVSSNTKSIFSTVAAGDVNVQRTTRKKEDINEVCVSKSDIVFVLDESGSIGASNFVTTKTFVSKYAASADFKENATQIGVVVFRQDARIAFPMDTYRSAGQIVNAINAIQYQSGGTNIAGALTFVNTHAFTASNGGRTDAFKTVVLMTDGKSSDASTQAKVLKDKGIIIVCIAIGSGVNYGQLNNIVSKPEYVLGVSDFNALTQIESILLKATCEPKYNCSGDLMTLQPTGKKIGGVPASQQEVDLDLKEIKKRKHCYISAGKNNCIHPALIAAIASRESRAGRLLQSTNGYGDNGAAYGIMQCDISANPVFPDYICTTFPWDSCEHIIMMTTKVVVSYIKQVQTEHPQWTLEQQLQGGVAAYNFGVRNVQTWQNLDVGTTGDDYSNDVIARAQYLVNKKIW